MSLKNQLLIWFFGETWAKINILAIYQSIMVLQAIVFLILPSNITGAPLLLNIFVGIQLLFVLHISVLLVLDIQQKREGAQIFFLGLIGYISAWFNGFLYLLDKVEFCAYGIGIMIVILCQALTHALKFTKTFDKNVDLNLNLEQKVIERTQELNTALKSVELSNKKIIGSIEYAQRIQNSLLPNQDFVRQILPNSFIIWQPRDIVGGDVYYIDKFDNGFLISVIDCTGHGVPGAFMSMLASSSLRRITSDEQCLNPSKILKRLNSIVKVSLQQDTEYASSNDGLDASVCFVNTIDKTIEYAGARLPITIFQNGTAQTIKGDRHSIGYKKSDLEFEFTNHKFTAKDEMTFYLYTDGIIDQLGGHKRIPFGNRKFVELLNETNDEPFDEQKSSIIEAFEEYKGSNPVQDDVTVIGFSV